MRFTRSTAVALAASLPSALAQTSTSCNPTEKTCPDDTGLSSSSYAADFTDGSSANASWSAATGTDIDYTTANGAVFTIESKDQAPTVQTDFYVFGARVDVVMKAAPGAGIVSSIVLESDDLDEIDWEFVGGSNDQVQSNFYGKGNTTTYDRVEYHDVTDTQGTWHTYSVDWTQERIEFLIDGSLVRTVEYSEALTVYGKNYPQTPMRLKLGNWDGGDSSSEGTSEWAGGKVDWSDAPFNMYVKSVTITNYNPACEYKYSDETGSWDSIDIIKTGDSCSASSSSSNTSASASGTSGASTSAPTSSDSVAAIVMTKSAPTTTITGSAYSTNSASISAVNAGSTGFAATTAQSNGTAASGSSSNTVTGPSSTSSAEASEGGASINTAMAAGSFFGMALALFML